MANNTTTNLITDLSDDNLDRLFGKVENVGDADQRHRWRRQIEAKVERVVQKALNDLGWDDEDFVDEAVLAAVEAVSDAYERMVD